MELIEYVNINYQELATKFIREELKINDLYFRNLDDIDQLISNNHESFMTWCLEETKDKQLTD